MNLLDILKQFKLIEPDPVYSEKSKRMILATRPSAPKGVKGTFVMFLRVIETASALALAGFFILLVTGGFSASKYLAPVQYSVIDPNGLHAEAQAIDMQIQLANLNYPEAPVSDASTPSADTAAKAAPLVASMMAVSSSATSSDAGTASGATAADTATASSSDATASSTAASTTLSVDQALQKLSE